MKVIDFTSQKVDACAWYFSNCLW